MPHTVVPDQGSGEVSTPSHSLGHFSVSTAPALWRAARFADCRSSRAGYVEDSLRSRATKEANPAGGPSECN